MGRKNFKIILVLCLFFALGAVTIGSMGHSSAEIDKKFLGPNNGSNAMRLGVWSEGNGILLDAPSAVFQVYARKGHGQVPITLEEICSTGARISVDLVDGNKHLADTPNDCDGSGDVKFKIDGNKFSAVDSTGAGADQWEKVLFKVSLKSGQPGAAQHFNIQTLDTLVTFDSLNSTDDRNNNSSLAKPIGDGSKANGTKCDNPTASTRDASEIRKTQRDCRYPDDKAFSVITESSGDDTFKLEFAPSCNYDEQEAVYLKWFDADQGAYGGNIKWSLYDLTDGGRKVESQDGGAMGGEGSFAFKSVGRLTIDHHYLWEWKNVNSSNGVQMWVPFSEFNTKLKCNDWKLDGNTNVEDDTISDNELTTFHHWVKNLGPANAQYNWHLEGCYHNDGSNCSDGDYGNNQDGNTQTAAGPPGSHNGSPNNVGVNEKKPNTNDYNYKFSANAPDNAKYCQRIVYTNATGRGTPEKHSTPDCVKLNSGPNKPNPTCESITVGSKPAPSPSNSTTLRFKVQVRGTNPENGTYSPDLGTEPQIGGGDWKDGGTTWNNLTAKSSHLYVYVWREYQNGSGQWKNYTGGDHVNGESHYVKEQSFDCYNAQCFASFVSDDDLKGKSGVIANRPYQVNVTIVNPAPNPSDPPAKQWGDLPASIDGSHLALYGNGGSILRNISGLKTGRSVNINFQVTAPGGAGTQLLDMHPTYNGLFDFKNAFNSCPLNVPVYEPFTLNFTPDAKSRPTRENPVAVDYSTTINSTETTKPVYVPTTSTFYKKPKSGGQTNYAGPVIGGTYPPGLTSNEFTGTYDVPPLSVSAGDKFCTGIHADYSKGYIGPGGPSDVAATTKAFDEEDCDPVVNEPYVHFAGSDVSAGGGFGDNCTTNTGGGIYAYMDTGGARAKGSGSQFGAQALGVIQGLSSANLRSAAPTGSTGLTFSNSVNLSGSPPGGPNVGGKFGLNSNCVPDYFSKKPTTVTNNDVTNLAPAIGTAGAQYYKPTTGAVATIAGGTIGRGVNEAVYVEGDVRITNNITYSGSRSQPSDVPSFYLIVKGGNIYIDPGVTQLDGVYIAQDNGGSIPKGKINTCSNGTNPYGVDSLYDNCKKQLVINGTFVAEQIFLERSYSSLRFSRSGEHILGGSNGSCGTLGADVPATGPGSALDCAAEIFNFSPEIFLSQPAGQPTSGPTTGKYDYITSLPPVL